MTHAKPLTSCLPRVDRPLDGLEATARPAPPLGVYLHFPWCLSKCGYCDFFSVPGESKTIPHERYADQVLREFERRLEALPPHRLTTLFLGGGTPSLWETRALSRVVARILSGFGAKAEEVELTVECNPSSFDESVAAGLRDAGVSRISLGLQSLDDEQLKFLGRRHDSRGGLRALELALTTGFPKVSCDLLFGLPRQTTETEVAQAKILAAYPISHLSVYALTIEENTPFARLKERGKLPLAVDERVAEAFVALHDELAPLGFEHYEISNYARSRSACRHNQQYWWGLPYLGLGVAAWGTVNDRDRTLRYRNPASVSRYLALDFTDKTRALYEPYPTGFADPVELLTPVMRLEERILLGLRLRAGLDLSDLERELGIPVLTESRKRAIERQVARGNLTWNGSRISIEPNAWLRADSTIVDLA